MLKLLNRTFYTSTLVFLFILISQVAIAQTGSIKGRLQGTNGDFLPGATVLLKPTNTGVATDENGYFELIKIPPGNYTLSITYLGYKTKEFNTTVTVGSISNLGNIKLEEDQRQLGEVEVKGSFDQGSDTKAINMTKTSPTVITVISAQSIGKLPTRNAAEAVRRAPGVSVQNSKGEGSFVSLRGTPTDWTATLINGDRLPVADEENTSRSFEFEVLPSDLISSVIVSRTVTPDMEGDNIGGVVNFQSWQAPEKRVFKLNLNGGWNFLAGKPLGQGSVLFGNRSKNEKFGFIVNGTYYGRNYAADAFRCVYSNNYNQALASYELKKYNGYRGTFGFNGALEYKFNNKLRVVGNVLGGYMTDNKQQKKVRYNYNDGSGKRIRLQSIHGLLVRQFYGGDLNIELKPNERWKVNIRAASYYNKFSYGNVPFKNKDARNGYFFVEFISPLMYYADEDFIDYRTGAAASPSDPGVFVGKVVGDDNPYGDGDYYNNIQPQAINVLRPDKKFYPEDFEFYQAFSELNTTVEKDPIVSQFDVFHILSNKVKIQFGGKMRIKQGQRSISLHQWVQNIPLQQQAYLLPQFQTEGFAKPGQFLAELGGNYDNNFQFLALGQRDNFVQALGDTLREYTMDVTNTEYRFWVGSQYRYTEYQYAGYGMATAKLGRVNMVGGVRMEYTRLLEYSDSLLTKKKPNADGTYSDSLVFDPVSGSLHPLPVERVTDLKYLAILPSLNINYVLSDKINLRFAVSRTFHRPNFEETKPGYGVYRIDELDLTYGNSKLKPTYAWNGDFTFEYFWGNKGIATLGGYYKFVTDHIFASTTSYVDGFGIVAKRYENAPKSWVGGVELGIQRQLDFLPKFLSGLGVSANFAYSWSAMQVPGRNFKQAMTEQSPMLYNVALYYEKHGITARIALNYTAPFLKYLNLFSVKELDGTLTLLHQDTQFDVYRGQNFGLECSAAYTLKKYYTVYAEATNLLDYPDLIYRGKPERPVRTEYYRPRGQIGFRMEF